MRFADLAPARLLRWVVAVGRPGVDHIAGTVSVLERLRIIAMRGVFHRIQVIQGAFTTAVSTGSRHTFADCGLFPIFKIKRERLNVVSIRALPRERPEVPTVPPRSPPFLN